MGHLGPKGIIRIRIGEQGQNRQQHLRYSQCRRPLVFQNIQTDHTTRIDIRMIDPRVEIDLGGLKGIIAREVDRELKDPAGKWRVSRSHDDSCPFI